MVPETFVAITGYFGLSLADLEVSAYGQGHIATLNRRHALQ